MKRRLFTILSALSPLLCVAVGVLWVRSYWVDDVVSFVGRFGSNGYYSVVFVQSNHGSMTLGLLGNVGSHPKLTTGSMDSASKWRLIHTAQPPHPWPTAGERWGISYEPAPVVQVWTLYSAYWIPVLLTALLPAIWLARERKRRRRLKHGLCPTCGYDLRASKDRCPECGTLIPVQTASGGGA